MLILLAKVALAYLPIAHFVALRPPIPFRQTQFVQVFRPTPAPFCKLTAGLGSTNKSATSLLLYYSRSVLSSVFPFAQTSWQIWQELSSFFVRAIKLQWVSGQLFLQGNNAVDELARPGAILVPSAITCSLSPLIHSCLFSDWRRTVSSKFFNSQVLLVSTEELVLLRLARCVLSRLHNNGHSFLLNSCL